MVAESSSTRALSNQGDQKTCALECWGYRPFCNQACPLESVQRAAMKGELRKRSEMLGASSILHVTEITSIFYFIIILLFFLALLSIFN